MCHPPQRVFILGLVLLAVGCTGPAGPGTDGLAEGEAPALAQVILFAALNSTSVLPPPPEEAGGAGWAMDFEAEVRCPGGGRVDLAASLNVAGAAPRAEYRLRQIHQDCGGGAGQPFRVSGIVPVAADLSVQHGTDGVSWEGATAGEIDWRTSGRSGRCTFALDFSGARSASGGLTLDLEGAVCGHALDQSVSPALD